MLTGGIASDEEPMGHWRYFPVAHGTPEEPLPPPVEFAPHYADGRNSRVNESLSERAVA